MSEPLQQQPSGTSERWTHNDNSIDQPTRFFEFGVRAPMHTMIIGPPTFAPSDDTETLEVRALNSSSEQTSSLPQSSASEQTILADVLASCLCANSKRRMVLTLDEGMPPPTTIDASRNWASQASQESDCFTGMRVIDFVLPEGFPQATVHEEPDRANPRVKHLTVDMTGVDTQEVEVDATCFYPLDDLYMPEVHRCGFLDQGEAAQSLNNHIVTQERLRINSDILSLKSYADRRHKIETQGFTVDNDNVQIMRPAGSVRTTGVSPRNRFGALSHHGDVTITRANETPGTASHTHETNVLYRPWIKPVARPSAQDGFHNVSIVERGDGTAFSLYAMAKTADIDNGLLIVPPRDDIDADDERREADRRGAEVISGALSNRNSFCKDEHKHGCA